jgi:hypothetical protein
MLVHYGSPSPSPEPVAASASTTTHAAIPPPPVFANEVDEDDEEDEEFNLANSFAIQSDAPSAVVAPLKNEIVVRSAPDVLLDVRHALHSLICYSTLLTRFSINLGSIQASWLWFSYYSSIR